jgi:hypothetical protein
MAEYAIGQKKAPFHSLTIIYTDTHNEDREKSSGQANMNNNSHGQNLSSTSLLFDSQ